MSVDELVTFLGFPTDNPRWAAYVKAQTPEWRRRLEGLARACKILQDDSQDFRRK